MIVSGNPIEARGTCGLFFFEPPEYNRFGRSNHIKIPERAIIRSVLSKIAHRPHASIRFTHGPHGKPFLEPASNFISDFNLSHSASQSVLAISNIGAIGVDIEHLSSIRHAQEVRDLIAHPKESIKFRQKNYGEYGGLRLWARKESILKLNGSGLLTDPRTLSVDHTLRKFSKCGDIERLLAWRSVVDQSRVKGFDFLLPRKIRKDGFMVSVSCNSNIKHVNIFHCLASYKFGLKKISEFSI